MPPDAAATVVSRSGRSPAGINRVHEVPAGHLVLPRVSSSVYREAMQLDR